MSEPIVGTFVHYRLTRVDAKLANKQRQFASENYLAHRKTGVQVHEGNAHTAGDVVPLLVVRVCPEEFSDSSSVCRDYAPGDADLVWGFPSSHYGVNGQAFLDGNRTIHITSAPEGAFNGGWTQISTPLETRYEYVLFDDDTDIAVPI